MFRAVPHGSVKRGLLPALEARFLSNQGRMDPALPGRIRLLSLHSLGQEALEARVLAVPASWASRPRRLTSRNRGVL